MYHLFCGSQQISTGQEILNPFRKGDVASTDSIGVSLYTLYNMEKRTGIWIPLDYIENTKLDWTNKVLLAEICSLHELPKGCIASNQKFGKLLGITSASVSKRITKLSRLGYIKTKNIQEKGMCIGRIIIPILTVTRTSTKNQSQEQERSIAVKGQGVVPKQPESTSSENKDVIHEQPGGSSKLVSEVLPEHPGSGSLTTREVVLEQPGGSSPGNINNTDINSRIDEQLPVQEEIKQALVQNTSENSVLTTSVIEQNISSTPLKDMREGMNDWFFDYPTWESDLYSLGLEKFVWKTARKYETDDPENRAIIEYFLTL